MSYYFNNEYDRYFCFIRGSIAPFMANFDASIGGNQSEIKYYDNSTHFICTWNNLYLRDQPNIGSFTFQAILQETGKIFLPKFLCHHLFLLGHIYFNYIQIPSMKISVENHPHHIGLSDAYVTERTTNEHNMRVITLYDKLNLDSGKIQSGLSVVFTMDKSTFYTNFDFQ